MKRFVRLLPGILCLILLLCACSAARSGSAEADQTAATNEQPAQSTDGTPRSYDPVPSESTAAAASPAESATAAAALIEGSEGDGLQRILCIGDSNTYGFDPRNYGARYDEELRWTGMLSREGYTVLNRGVNGACVPREAALASMLDMVKESLPLDVITVMLGTNDLCCGYDAETTAAEMESLLIGLLKTAPEAKLILIAPPSVVLGEDSIAQRIMAEWPKLTEAYAALAERLQITFGDAGQWGIALGSDGVHFLPEGNEAFAAHLLELLR